MALAVVELHDDPSFGSKSWIGSTKCSASSSGISLADQRDALVRAQDVSQGAPPSERRIVSVGPADEATMIFKQLAQIGDLAALQPRHRAQGVMIAATRLHEQLA
jgi:hypothetical protein